MKPIFVIFLLLATNTLVLGQNDVISKIRDLYKETQSAMLSYTKLAKDDFENSSEGGEIVAYKKDKEIRLIRTNYYGHMGQSESEYYFLGHKVYFIYAKDYSYNAPASHSDFDESKTKLEESRYYFWNEKMIRWIMPDGTFGDSESVKFSKESMRRNDWSSELLEMMGESGR